MKTGVSTLRKLKERSYKFMSERKDKDGSILSYCDDCGKIFPDKDGICPYCGSEDCSKDFDGTSFTEQDFAEFEGFDEYL
jgi:rRNA maturation endonuclease Nob1